MKESLPRPRHTNVNNGSDPMDIIDIRFNRSYTNANLYFNNINTSLNNGVFYSDFFAIPAPETDVTPTTAVKNGSVVIHSKGLYQHTLMTTMLPHSYDISKYKEMHICLIDTSNGDRIYGENFTIKPGEINSYIFNLIHTHDNNQPLQIKFIIVQNENINTSIDVIKVSWQIQKIR